MSRAQAIFGPILNPRADGSVDFLPHGALACDNAGKITFIGDAGDSWLTNAASAAANRRVAHGIICPPFLDAHIHIPQHPIRGHFMDGVDAHPPEGRLIAGLNRNVFPAEAKCADPNPAEWCVQAFRKDTLSKGVVGGAAYMTVHAMATGLAIQGLFDLHWHVGLVLMNQNCPKYLRTDEAKLERDIRTLADLSYPLGGQGKGIWRNRLIMTDRFAVAVDTPLRRRGVALAKELGLRTQTHLNEQVSEKRFVERELYPSYKSYTDVYATDGLLDHDAIIAHCIHMREDELDLVASKRSVVAHCPTSNTLLCSGIMPLDEIASRGIEYAICTDVGASPTTSILAEMAHYLKVHAGRSSRATPSEALYRSTLAPAKVLGIDDSLGTFAIGRPMSFVEIGTSARDFASADDAILRGLLALDGATLSDPDRLKALDKLQAAQLDVGPELSLLEHDVAETVRRLDQKVVSVTLGGEEVFRRSEGQTV